MTSCPEAVRHVLEKYWQGVQCLHKPVSVRMDDGSLICDVWAYWYDQEGRAHMLEQHKCASLPKEHVFHTAAFYRIDGLHIKTICVQVANRNSVGRVAERSKARHLKCRDLRGSVGSNPTSS